MVVPWKKLCKQIHSVTATATSAHDSQVLEDLLHGEETRVWGDSAYSGQTETLRQAAPAAQDFSHEKGRRNQPPDEAARRRNRTKSKSGPGWSISLR